VNPLIDFTTRVGQRAMAQLTTEQLVWFTTVGADHAPQPSPVWFLWDGEAILIFSRPDAPKVRNVGHNPHVALNFRGDALVMAGQAVIVQTAPDTDVIAAYVEKYREGIVKFGMTPDTFTAMYSTPLRVTPTRLRSN